MSTPTTITVDARLNSDPIDVDVAHEILAAAFEGLKAGTDPDDGVAWGPFSTATAAETPFGAVTGSLEITEDGAGPLLRAIWMFADDLDAALLEASTARLTSALDNIAGLIALVAETARMFPESRHREDVADAMRRSTPLLDTSPTSTRGSIGLACGALMEDAMGEIANSAAQRILADGFSTSGEAVMFTRDYAAPAEGVARIIGNGVDSIGVTEFVAGATRGPRDFDVLAWTPFGWVMTTTSVVAVDEENCRLEQTLSFMAGVDDIDIQDMVVTSEALVDGARQGIELAARLASEELTDALIKSQAVIERAGGVGSVLREFCVTRDENLGLIDEVGMREALMRVHERGQPGADLDL